MNAERESIEAREECLLARVSRNEHRLGNPLKWGLWLLGLLVIWVANDRHFPSGVLLGSLLYALTNMFFTSVFWAGQGSEAPALPVQPAAAESDGEAGEAETAGVASTAGGDLWTIIRRASVILSYGADYAYVSYIILHTGGLSSEGYLLYCVLAFKAAFYYRYYPAIMLVPFLSGLLYVGVLYVGLNSLFFLADRVFLMRYLFMFGIMFGTMGIGWLMEHRRASPAGPHGAQGEPERQAQELERTARAMGQRVLELRSLQEGVKVINSALDLGDVLRLIVANASGVLRGARCSIGLLEARSGEIVTRAASGILEADLWGTRFKRGEGVAGWVVKNKQEAFIPDVGLDNRFIRVGEWPIASMITVPLVSDGISIGALSATSAEVSAFTREDLSMLGAFADQAAIAVANSRLYERLGREKAETARLYQSVREKSSELEAILWGIGDGVIVTDPQLRLTMLNPVAARMFAVTGRVAHGTPVTRVVPNEALLKLLETTLQGEEALSVQEISLDGDRDGAEKIYQALATTIAGDDGVVQGVVAVLRDITGQKELERMKSNFLSVVSHELKTPLHSIKGFVDIILMGRTGDISETQRDFLNTVRSQTDHLQTLIQDLLEFSRLESGQVKLRLEQVSVAKVAGEVVDNLTPMADEKGVMLQSKVPVDLSSIEADRMRITQVLTNLAHNAIKFTPEGGSVTVGAADLRDQVMIFVSDTGIGIPAYEREKIFDRFYQVDGTTTRQYRGTGLGLTICKHIVEYHQGRIWVEGDEGEGSTFLFTLPKELEAEEALAIDFTTLPPRRV